MQVKHTDKVVTQNLNMQIHACTNEGTEDTVKVDACW